MPSARDVVTRSICFPSPAYRQPSCALWVAWVRPASVSDSRMRWLLLGHCCPALPVRGHRGHGRKKNGKSRSQIIIGYLRPAVVILLRRCCRNPLSSLRRHDLSHPSLLHPLGS